MRRPATSARRGPFVGRAVRFGENPNDSCVVADTVDDFSNTQGENGWWYGYWTAASDADGSYDPELDFSSMEYCGPNSWVPPGGCPTGPDGEWTQNLSDGLQHAETDPVLELPVRRWVSDVSGKARIFAEHFINGGRSGDGTRALLLVDGIEIGRTRRCRAVHMARRRWTST